MVTGASRRLATFLLVVITLIVMVVEAPDLTRYHRHQPQQQDLRHPGSILPHDDVSSWQTGYRCDDVCELRQTVQRLSAAQLDYGRALHAVYGLVDTVRQELVAAR